METIGKFFIAVPIPKEIAAEIYRKIKKVIEKNEEEKLRIVTPEKYHITVYYIGYVPKEHALEFFNKIPNVEPFEVVLKDVGYFHNRVLWIGIKEEKGMLEKMHSIFTGEKLIPHLTIARNKKMSKMAFQNLIGKLRALKLNYKFIAKKVILYQSIPTSEGFVYKEIKIKELG